MYQKVFRSNVFSLSNNKSGQSSWRKYVLKKQLVPPLQSRVQNYNGQVDLWDGHVCFTNVCIANIFVWFMWSGFNTVWGWGFLFLRFSDLSKKPAGLFGAVRRTRVVIVVQLSDGSDDERFYCLESYKSH